LRDLLARHRDPHLQHLKIKTQKFVCQNSIMGQSYGLRRIFLPAFPILDFPNMALPSAKPDVAAQGASLAGKPMGAQP
jgi:hypothetical protein